MKFLFAATLLLLSVFGKRDEEKLLSQPEKIELSQPEQIEQIIKQTILTPMEMMLVQFESMPKMDDMEIQETAITRHAQMIEANKEHLQLLENQKEIMVKPLENLENLEIVESVKAMFDHMIKMSSKIPTVEEIVKSIKEEQENTMKMMNDFSKIMTDMEKSLPIVMKQMEDDYESMAKDLFEGFNDEDMADSMKYLFGDDDSLFDELKVEDNLKIQAEKLVGAKNRLEKEINEEELDLTNDHVVLGNENEDEE